MAAVHDNNVTCMTSETSPDGCRGDEQFKCVDGTIICEVQRCDDEKNCPDGDDEEGCGRFFFFFSSCFHPTVLLYLAMSLSLPHFILLIPQHLSLW